MIKNIIREIKTVVVNTQISGIPTNMIYILNKIYKDNTISLTIDQIIRSSQTTVSKNTIVLLSICLSLLSTPLKELMERET